MSFGPSEGYPIAPAVILIAMMTGAISFGMGVSVDGSLFRAAVVGFLVFSWATGLNQYIFSNLSTPKSYLFAQIKGYLIRSTSSLLYLTVFLGVFLPIDSSIVNRATYMTVLSILSLIWAFLLYRRIRLIEDTAYTRLNSAAQGYAVLTGKVSLYHNEVVRGPSYQLPVMVWYSKYLHTSSAGFLLDDGNGTCTVNPRDAEVITPRYHYNSYTFYAIYPGETIYIIGQFETLSKQRNEYERKALVSSKIAEWKHNRVRFLDYFDRNNDGVVDDAEMAAVRNTADRYVDDSLEEIYQKPASHVVSRPNDGRPFILSSIHPDELLTRYKRAMIFHLITWVALAIYALAMLV